MKTSNQDFKKNYPSFLEEEIGIPEPENALFHIIPVPYEKTVSYGGGTASGPLKILEASQQLELFDGFSNPSLKGIYTKKPVFAENIDSLFELIHNEVTSVLSLNKIPVILGGEHTVSVCAFKSFLKNRKKFGIVQIDAHGDLRDEYEKNKFSHACVMKRALDMGIDIFQIGVRSLSFYEKNLRESLNIKYLDAIDIYKKGLPENLFSFDFPENIYLTIDVDGFDPSVIPATGTPEPGGLLWYDGLEIIKKIAREKNIIGFDLVELSPKKNLHYAEFTCAKLIYHIMGMFR
ncbi:MAG: agmatinase [Deltaproteobacteria bacterium]|nr:MAG: agmatinase [Deltaproteobacteria bacterium]